MNTHAWVIIVIGTLISSAVLWAYVQYDLQQTPVNTLAYQIPSTLPSTQGETGIQNTNLVHGTSTRRLATSCLVGGLTLFNGQSHLFYRASHITAPRHCTDIAQRRTCWNGTLDGDTEYQFTSCQALSGEISPPKTSPVELISVEDGFRSCVFARETISHGGGIVLYEHETVSPGQSCQPEYRACQNGTLSGSFIHASCTVDVLSQPTASTSEVMHYTLSTSSPDSHQDCQVAGITVTHGNSTRFFKEPLVVYGQSCTQEMRRCVDGALSGSFLHTTCRIQARPEQDSSPQQCRFTLRDYGAVGDGVADDSGALKHAITVQGSDCVINGEGLTYKITYPISLAQGSTLHNATIKMDINDELYPQMALGIRNISDVTLENIAVDRGDRSHIGERGDASILVEGAHNIRFHNVELHGDGHGSAIWVFQSQDVALSDIYIHDMHWTEAVDDNEQMFGIFVSDSRDVLLDRITINGLYGVYQGDVFPINTDGITAGGTNGLTITNSTITKVGEGIDITGSLGNDNFTIRNTNISHANNVCFKVFHRATNGLIHNTTADHCALSAYAFGGNISGLLIDGATARHVGSNGLYASHPSVVAGFQIFETSTGDLPQDIHIQHAQASGATGEYTMEYGFYSPFPPDSHTGLYPYTVYNTDSFNHTRAGNTGFSATSER